MGGWISRETQEEIKERERIENEEREEEQKIQEEIQRRYEIEQAAAIKRWEEHQRQEARERRKLQIKEQQQSFKKNLIRGRVTKNLNLINDLLRAFDLPALDEMPDSPYTTHQVSRTSKERQVRNIFRKLNKPLFMVTEVLKVDNPFLTLTYKISKEKFKDLDPAPLKERTLYHGTTEELLDRICAGNFDRATMSDEKFGQGVIFTTHSYYATCFKNVGGVMVLAKVFFGGLQDCDGDISVPEEPSYTTANGDKSVFVKYDDASFCPGFIVRYEEFSQNHVRMKRVLEKITSEKDLSCHDEGSLGENPIVERDL